MGAARQHGFTLIEAMTTVAILGILSTIAVRYYNKQKLEGQRSDAIIALTTLAQYEERYMTENGSYASSIALLNPPTSIVTAAGTTPKGFYQLKVNNNSTALNANCNPTVNGGTVRYYCYTLTAKAINTQANDTPCATFTLDQTGKQGSTGGGTDCWSK